jgi:SPP1 gp7 family putative phage head morphogenesis protein
VSSRLDIAKYLADLSGRYARAYTDAIDAMFVAEAMGSKSALRAAREDWRETVTETMGIAEVLGAMTMLKEASEVVTREPELFHLTREPKTLLRFVATPTQTLLPSVSFAEALDNLMLRVPVTFEDAAARTSQAIGDVYARGKGVAFAQAAESVVTERVQKALIDAHRLGLSEFDAARRIMTDANAVRSLGGPWTESYSRLVFRNNSNHAATAGRFRQARDPDVKAATPAFRFDATGDRSTRKNHLAADGLIMAVDDPDWSRIATPLGHNCRCEVSPVGLPELRRRGLFSDGRVVKKRIPNGARPDDGFIHSGRPDLTF